MNQFIDESTDHGCGLSASIVETVCALPTVPTKSWCDSAAGALGGLFARSATVVVVCSLMAEGAIRKLHGLGVAVRAVVGDPAVPSKSNDGASLTDGSDQNRDRLDGEMRCGLEGLMHLGWASRGLVQDRADVRFVRSNGRLSVPGLGCSEPDVGGVGSGSGSLAESEDSLLKFPMLSRTAEPWHLSSPFSVLGRVGTTRVVAGVASIGAPELGRRIAVYVGDLDAERSPTSVCAEVLSACLPLVARKASLALDRTWTDKGSWLSNREKLVLEQLIIGRSVPEIAAVLQRSHHTVHDNVKSLHRKLAASTRGELIARALGISPRAAEADSRAAS